MPMKFKVGDRVEINEFWGKDSLHSCGDGPGLLERYPVGSAGTVLWQSVEYPYSVSVSFDNGLVDMFHPDYLNVFYPSSLRAQGSGGSLSQPDGYAEVSQEGGVSVNYEPCLADLVKGMETRELLYSRELNKCSTLLGGCDLDQVANVLKHHLEVDKQTW